MSGPSAPADPHESSGKSGGSASAAGAPRAGLVARLDAFYGVTDQGGGGRLVAMEGMRGLAVLLVFFVHFNALFKKLAAPGSPAASTFKFLGTVGHSGVDLFFVLSGYLIYGALIKRETPYFDFIRRRVERIYPAFFAVFLLYVGLSLAAPSQSKLEGSPAEIGLYLVQNLLLLPGVFDIKPLITVAWSLSYEFFFYVTVPLLVLVTGMRRWPRVARVVLFSAALASCLAWSAMGQPIDLRMTMFLPGILLYEAVSSGALKAKLGPKGEVLSGVVFAVCVTLTYVLKQAILEGRQAAAKDPLQTVMVVPSYSRVAVLGVGCFLLALYCFQTRGPIVRFFSWRPMRYLGNISYSYYLIHGITLNAASVVAGKVVKNGAAGGIGMTALMLLGFAATFVSSTILFGIVEKPISLEGKSVGQVVRDLAGKLRAAPSSRAA